MTPGRHRSGVRHRRATAGWWRAAAALAILLAAAAQARASNKWRVQCSGNAESDGVLTFYLVAGDADPLAIEVEVFAGTRENAVAETIQLAFASRIAATHTVEVDDGEDVLVKKRKGQPDFQLELSGSTVEGVRIRLDPE